MRLGSTLFKKNANIAIGLMITLALSGGIMGNSIFAHIVQHIGWRHALITASIVGIFCLLIAFIFLKDFSHNPKKSIPYSSALNKKNILFGTVLGLINLPVFVVGSLWGNYYLIQAYHLSMTQAASFSTLIFAGIIIGSPCWGFVADKILNPKIILLFGGVILLLLSILVSIKILSLYLLALLFLGLGFFCSVQNLIYPLIGKTNNPTLTSTSTAVAALISNSIGAGMQIASPLLFIGLWNLLSTFSNLHHFF